MGENIYRGLMLILVWIICSIVAWSVVPELTRIRQALERARPSNEQIDAREPKGP